VAEAPSGLCLRRSRLRVHVFCRAAWRRKRVPVWRLGRAQTWMRGHLWLGALSLPIHSVPRRISFWRHTHARADVAAHYHCVQRAFFGAVLQHYIPRVMTADVPLETIYDEIGQCSQPAARRGRPPQSKVFAAQSGRQSLAGRIDRAAGGIYSNAPYGRAHKRRRGRRPRRRNFIVERRRKLPARHFYFNEVRPFSSDPAERRL